MGKVDDGIIYIFDDITVRSYNATKYLSFSKGSSATEIDKSGNVQIPSNEEITMEDCDVIGIVNLKKHRLCLGC